MGQEEVGFEDLKPEQQQRSSFASNRRTGSSWNRGSSAWSVGGTKEHQRVRRRGTMDHSAADEDYEAANVSATASGKRGWRNEEDLHSASPEAVPRLHVHVKKEQGIFQVKGSVETVVDPNTLYNIITDYDSNPRVFRDVDRVHIEDRGSDKIVTQSLHWNFLMWSGNYDIKMKIKNNPEKMTVSYDLEQPGFLKVFNGSWTVEPLVADGMTPTSKLVVNQKTLPSFFPSGLLGSYASRIMTGQVKNFLTDLAAEASKVKKNSGS